jgi:hypothetical protein
LLTSVQQEPPLKADTNPYLKPAKRWHAIVFVLVAIALGGGWLLIRGGRIGPASADAAWIPAHPSDRWQCIVIHHSGSEEGGAERFDQWHRERGWEGLGYHFVIGNGTDTDDGEIEVGFRWTQQERGAHCKTDDGYYNQHSIGICLVGNFDLTRPTPAQIHSLVRLCRYLCKRFHIPPSHIYTHGGITGKTDCPGKNFDVEGIRENVGGEHRH